MQYRNRPQKVDAFIEICQQRGLKVTPQRVAILRELLNCDTHPTADAVYQAVIGDYPNISYDTVNRTLSTFSKLGVVDVVEVFGGAKRFDPNVADHHHLHCTQCGKIIDFTHSAYDELTVPEGVRQKFKVTGKRVVLKGICNACLQ